MDDIESDSVVNHQPEVVDDRDDIDSNGVNNSLLSRQLINAAASLKTSMDSFGVKVNEMKTHQNDLEAKISRIEYMVFNNRRYETQNDKPQLGHDVDALSEAPIQLDDAKPDVGNDANNANPEFGNDASNVTPDKRDLRGDFEAEDHSFMSDDDDVVDDMNKDCKTLNALRVSFGAAIVNGKTNSSVPINVEISNNVFTDLSFNGYQATATNKSLRLVTQPKCINWQLTHTSVHAIYILMQKLEELVSNTPEAALRASASLSTSVKRRN